jgi:hypothetical protein
VFAKNIRAKSDLNIMELDEIYGFLTTHEMILQCNDQEIAKKKK